MPNDVLLNKWRTEYKKGFTKPLILITLSKIEQSYPYLLTKEIMKLTNGNITITGSNIYPILTGLESDGLITSQPDENDRKYYKLTEKGRKFLLDLGVSIKEFTEMIADLTIISKEDLTL